MNFNYTKLIQYIEREIDYRGIQANLAISITWTLNSVAKRSRRGT